VISEALTLMTGPKPFVIDRRRRRIRRGKRIANRVRGDAAQGDCRFRGAAPDDEWNAIALKHTSDHGNPKGVVTHHRGAYLNAVSNILAGQLGQIRLSLDPADVPLQRLVLSLDHRGLRRIQCLPRKVEPTGSSS